MTLQNGAPAVATPVGQLFYGKPLIFSEKRHMYFWGGEHVPSVTTITKGIAKDALIQWAANMAVDHIVKELGKPDVVPTPELFAAARKAHAVKRDTAADEGRQVHLYARDCFIARHLLPISSALSDKVRTGCEVFAEWFRTHQTYAYGVERKVFSEKHKYAGTTDFFGRIDGKLGVMDIKTSGGIYEEHWLQCTGYELALTEELELRDPIRRWLLHLNKDTGEFTLHERPMSPVHLHAWVALVVFDRYWRLMKKDLR